MHHTLLHVTFPLMILLALRGSFALIDDILTWRKKKRTDD